MRHRMIYEFSWIITFPNNVIEYRTSLLLVKYILTVHQIERIHVMKSATLISKSYYESYRHFDITLNLNLIYTKINYDYSIVPKNQF